MNDKRVSPMVSEGSVFERVLLFQSFRQFLSYTITLIIIVSILFILSRVFSDGKVSLDIVISAVIGTLPILYMVLPCSFVLSTPPNDTLIETIDARLYKMGYVLKEHKVDRCFVYRSKLPRILSWDENNVIIHAFPSKVEVSGSRIAIKSIRRWLLRQVDLF
jgi:hypothetical protein